VTTAFCACSTTSLATRFTRDAPPRRELLFFAAPDREPLELDAPRFIPLFFALPRFIVERPLPPFFAVLFLAPLRFDALFLAPPFFAALFFAPPFFAALFLAPERLLIAGPRRVLFFPALRFVPRPDFFVAIAASPPPEVIVGAVDAVGAARIVRRVAQFPGELRASHAQNMAARHADGQHGPRLPDAPPTATIDACSP